MTPPAKAPARARVGKPKTEGGQRLRDIRLKLSWTMSQMADRLGLSGSLYCGMEYGRSPVRPEVLQVAEELLKDCNFVVEELRSFDNTDMPTLLAQWAKRLDAEGETVSNLSELIGVDKSTVSRWQHGLQRPTLRTLLVIERSVAKAEARLKKMKAALEKKEVAASNK